MSEIFISAEHLKIIPRITGPGHVDIALSSDQRQRLALEATLRSVSPLKPRFTTT